MIDRCVFGHKSIDRSVYKKTFEILKPQTLVPRNFLGIFLGNSEEHLISSIDRWDNLIDRSHCYALVHLSDRSMRFWTYIHRSIRLKKIDVLKPQTLVPRNFLGIFRRNSEEEKGFLGIPSEYSEEIPRK